MRVKGIDMANFVRQLVQQNVGSPAPQAPRAVDGMAQVLKPRSGWLADGRLHEIPPFFHMFHVFHVFISDRVGRVSG